MVDLAVALAAARRAEEGPISALAPRVRRPLSFDIVARWQSALSIRQAFVRLKFGAEADKSAETGKVLEQLERPYEFVLSGPMGMFLAGKPGDAAKALSEVTSLSSRRTGEIKPVQIEVGKPGKTMDVLFAFPRSMPFKVEDKEVELTTKLSTSTLKYKFKTEGHGPERQTRDVAL